MSRRLAVLMMTAGWWLSVSPGLGGEVHTSTNATGRVHTYYIAADEVDWNYAPADIDHMTGKPYDQRAHIFVENDAGHIGRIYKKAVYREYTDVSFTVLKPRVPEWEHLGIVGPVLRGEAGDTLKIVFKNNAHFPFSMHPHGVLYDPSSEGVKGIPPGESFTYTWILDPRAAPKGGEPSSKLWLYHSHANERRDVAAGLIGAIIVSAKGTVRTDGTPKDVDREFVAFFYTADETQTWYTAAMGSLHTAHWHANTVMLDERATDVVPLMPAEMHTVDMVAENPGMWMLHCHIEFHLASGMYTHYMVEPAETLTTKGR